QIKNFSGKNVPEYKIQQFPKPNLLLLHYGIFRIVWDWILLTFTFYIAFMVPYYVTFGRRMGLNDTRKSIVDLVVEVLLITDIVVNFNTTYVNTNGQLVHNRRQLAIHYIRSWFLIDFLAAMPVDFTLAVVQTIWTSELDRTTDNSRGIKWSEQIDALNETKLQVSSTKQNSVPIWNVVSLLQVMKLAKLLRLARLFENLSRLSQHSIVVLSLLMFTFTLVAHWFACIWYVIGETDHSEAGWLQELARRLNASHESNESEPPGDGARYFTALYFTCSSLTSVGFGNVSANTTEEKIFAICIMLLGALMHAAVFGNVTAIIQRIYARRTAFQSRAQDLKDFVRVHHIPKQLSSRMEDYFQTTWAISRGIDLSEVLSIYPEELQRDIALYLIGASVSAKELQLVLFTYSGKNDWFGTYKTPSGDFFQTVLSCCDAKSLTYCDLQSIDLAVLNEVLLQYPQFKAEFAEYLYEDLSFNIQEGAKFMDTDALLVPVITLPPEKDNTSLCSVPPESRVFDETATQPTQNVHQSTNNDRGNMEAGLMSLAVHSQHVSGVSSNEAIAASHSLFSCASAANSSTGSFRAFFSSFSSTSSSSPSSSSDTVGMRYYPRQSTIARGYQKKYDKQRATFWICSPPFRHLGVKYQSCPDY
ncbi:Potassium voltage-gated channel subfamily H member 8, partial [Fasciola gigantica]